MHTKLTIPERLKDLKVSEKRMSLQELSDATGIPSSFTDDIEHTLTGTAVVVLTYTSVDWSKTWNKF